MVHGGLVHIAQADRAQIALEFYLILILLPGQTVSTQFIRAVLARSNARASTSIYLLRVATASLSFDLRCTGSAVRPVRPGCDTTPAARKVRPAQRVNHERASAHLLATLATWISSSRRWSVSWVSPVAL